MLFQLQTKVVMVSAFLSPTHSFRLIGFSSFQHARVLQFDELNCGINQGGQKAEDLMS
jgi:hypothetical protein